MPHFSRPTLACALLIALTVPQALAAEGAEASRPALPQSDLVESLRVIEPRGGRLSWSVQGDWIAYDQRGADGFYDIRIMSPEGGLQKCLTCKLRELRKAHAYNPSWHPSGDYLVFQVQLVGGKLGLSAAEMTTPDRGLHSSLWMIDRAGKHFYQLSGSAQTAGGALLDPHFSHEGDRLAWSERVKSRVGRWGEWVVRVAEVSFRAGVPRLRKVKSYKPGENRRYVRVSGFSPADDALLLSGNLDTGLTPAGMDTYRMSLADGSLTRITRTPREWDEGASFSPDGTRIAWSSNRGVGPQRGPGQQVRVASARAERRDLWLMNADASDQQRLTFLNHEAAPESLRGAVVSDFDWSPDGTAIAVHVVTDLLDDQERIYLVRLRPTP